MGQIIDDLHTSTEEKLEAHNKLKLIELDAMGRAIQFETALINRQADIIVAEAKGESYIQRTWRPWLMTSFGAIVVNNYILTPWLMWFGVDAPVLDLPTEMWTLLTVGVGGYIGGRTLEKIQKNGSVKGVMKEFVKEK